MITTNLLCNPLTTLNLPILKIHPNIAIVQKAHFRGTYNLLFIINIIIIQACLWMLGVVIVAIERWDMQEVRGGR